MSNFISFAVGLLSLLVLQKKINKKKGTFPCPARAGPRGGVCGGGGFGGAGPHGWPQRRPRDPGAEPGGGPGGF